MAALAEKIVASLFDQSDEIADEITHSHPLLNLLDKKGRIIKHKGGESYRKPVMYNQNRAGGFYSGLGNFNLEVKQDFTAFQFEIRQAYEPFVVTGRDVRANAGSKYRLLDLLKTKNMVTKANLKNTIHASLMSDGTGFGGIGFDGIQLAVSASPSSGTYGNITRSSATYAQNDVTTVSGGLSAANVQSTLTSAILKISRNYQTPDCALAGATAWKHLHDSMTAIQRITNEADKGKAGFKSLLYDGVEFWYDGAFGNTSGTSSYGANHVRIFNSEYISFDVEESTYMKPLNSNADSPVDQDGVFVVVICEGNLCVSAPQLQSLVKEA